MYIHPLSDVKSKKIGKGTTVWQFVVILPGAQIGKSSNICSHCFIENDVKIGDRVTIKNGVNIWDYMKIENDVFIGPNVTFVNDSYPKFRKSLISNTVTKNKSKNKSFKIKIKRGAIIGAGSIILPGLTIGTGSFIAAGSLVTKDVLPKSLVKGNPAKHVKFINKKIKINYNPEYTKKQLDQWAKQRYHS